MGQEKSRLQELKIKLKVLFFKALARPQFPGRPTSSPAVSSGLPPVSTSPVWASYDSITFVLL